MFTTDNVLLSGVFENYDPYLTKKGFDKKGV